MTLLKAASGTMVVMSCCFGLAFTEFVLGQVATGDVPGRAVADAPPAVKLLEGGSGPRRELRYAFRSGTTELLAVDNTTSVRAAVAGQQVPDTDSPTVRLNIQFETMEVQPNGDATMRVELTDAEMLTPPGQKPGAAERPPQPAKRKIGVTGRVTMTARGLPRDAKFELPADADQRAAPLVRAAEQQMAQVAVPLPAEAVGLGAKWEVTRPIQVQGVKALASTVYALTELTADGAVVSVAYQLTAEPGQQPGGGLGTVERLVGSGRGTSRQRFARLVPTEATTTLDVVTVLVQGQGAGRQEMTLSSKVGVTMRPREKP